jgi:hypothetical protein
MVGLILDYFKVCMRDSLPLLRLRLGKNGFALLPWQIPDLGRLKSAGRSPPPALGVLGYLKGRVEGG